MDFIFELICDLLFSSAVENPKIKPWVKTTVVSILCGLLTAFAVFLFYVGLQSGSIGSLILGGVLLLLFGILGPVYVVKRHKRGWKSTYSRK